MWFAAARSSTETRLDHPFKMAEHLKENEVELNQLLSEYWKLRFDTGEDKLNDYRSYFTLTLVEVYMEGLATKLGLDDGV
jgi:kinetochore protein Nuf2